MYIYMYACIYIHIRKDLKWNYPFVTTLKLKLKAIFPLQCNATHRTDPGATHGHHSVWT